MAGTDAQTRRWTTCITPAVVATIVGLGIKRAPLEACGVVVPDQSLTGGEVIELPNHARRHRKYVIEFNDLEAALDHWLGGTGAWYRDHATPVPRFDFVVWHTHPDGFVGPSAGDMVERRKADRTRCRYLVIALPHGEASVF